LIAFTQVDTVCDQQKILNSKKLAEFNFTNIKRGRSLLHKALSKVIHGANKVTLDNYKYFINLINASEKNILIIGSGSRGVGIEALYENKNIVITGIDIYASDNVDFIADAHYLPFADKIFDGVIIQAVLEHVLDPQSVVNEIHRVLKSDGYVYAETPFMQQVHEGAYDYYRFTVLGHRYLFKKFELISMGGIKGAGTVLAWSVRYLLWGIFNNRKISLILSAPFFLAARLFDRLSSRQLMADNSSGVFFLGKKSNLLVKQISIPALYTGNQGSSHN
jgi:SAM-dependent methyltransferase